MEMARPRARSTVAASGHCLPSSGSQSLLIVLLCFLVSISVLFDFTFLGSPLGASEVG